MTSNFFDELKKRRDFFQTNYPMIKIGLEPNDKSYEVLKNTCPICGYMTLDSRIDWDICLICFWEDDGSDDLSPDEESSPNHMTLNEGRIEFQRTWEMLISYHAQEDDLIANVRKKFFELNSLISNNRVEAKQSIIDLQKDILEVLEKNKIYGLAKLFK